MKKTTALVGILMAASLTLTACGSDDSTTGDSTPTASDPTATITSDASKDSTYGLTATEICQRDYADLKPAEPLKIRLITDVGKISDGGFNEFSWEGVEAAKDCWGADVGYIETASENDYAKNISLALSDDPDIIVTIGFLLTDATLEAAKANPDVKFIGIDQAQETYPANYVGVQYREDQGAYIAGVAAAKLSKTGVVGVVAGLESVPAVVRLVNGYIAGAKATNPDITVLSTYNQSFSDVAKGASDGRQFMSQGADVIFNAGGLTGDGGVKAATDAGKWGIGVDVDEYATTYSNGSAPGAKYLATSVVKRVDLGVLYQEVAAIKNTWQASTFTLDASNGGISYAPAHDAALPAEVTDAMVAAEEGLADGSIDTGVDPATGQMK